MGEVINEVANAVKTLGLSENDIHLLGKQVGEKVFRDCLSHFVKSGDRRWWWEDFSFPYVAYRGLVKPYEYLETIIPAGTERVWLVVEDIGEPYYPVFDISFQVIEPLIGECFGFEYYLIDKSKQWLLCENHHNVLYCVGDELRMLPPIDGVLQYTDSPTV